MPTLRCRASTRPHCPQCDLRAGGIEHQVAPRHCNTLEFIVHLETLQTGIELRDRHMRDDVFEVQRFPVARLRVLHPPLPGATTSGTALGELTVHGQTRPVNVAFKLKPRSGYDVTAS